MEVVVMKKMSENYVKNAENARKEYKGALVLDVTKRGGMGYLSPESEWRGIKIEGREEMGRSIKGIWEGLKIFRRRKEVDVKYWMDENKIGEERGCKTYGKLEGIWWNGEIIGIDEGIEKIKELYRKEVKRRYEGVLKSIKIESEKRDVILLEDGEEKRKSPFSHAMIIKEIIDEELVA